MSINDNIVSTLSYFGTMMLDSGNFKSFDKRGMLFEYKLYLVKQEYLTEKSGNFIIQSVDRSETYKVPFVVKDNKYSVLDFCKAMNSVVINQKVKYKDSFDLVLSFAGIEFFSCKIDSSRIVIFYPADLYEKNKKDITNIIFRFRNKYIKHYSSYIEFRKIIDNVLRNEKSLDHNVMNDKKLGSILSTYGKSFKYFRKNILDKRRYPDNVIVYFISFLSYDFLSNKFYKNDDGYFVLDDIFNSRTLYYYNHQILFSPITFVSILKHYLIEFEDETEFLSKITSHLLKMYVIFSVISKYKSYMVDYNKFLEKMNIEVNHVFEPGKLQEFDASNRLYLNGLFNKIIEMHDKTRIYIHDFNRVLPSRSSSIGKMYIAQGITVKILKSFIKIRSVDDLYTDRNTDTYMIKVYSDNFNVKFEDFIRFYSDVEKNSFYDFNMLLDLTLELPNIWYYNLLYGTY
ncbi:MAG: hypothetical protein QXF12_02340 [Candidatus Aenigmatarchaeota archaeon]